MTRKARSSIEETIIHRPRAFFSKILKVASSIIAVKLLYISTLIQKPRKSKSPPLALDIRPHGILQCFQYLLRQSWKVLMVSYPILCLNGRNVPSKSSLSAISNSFKKTSTEAFHQESPSRVGGANYSSVLCIDMARPKECALEMYDGHGRSSLQVCEHNQDC